MPWQPTISGPRSPSLSVYLLGEVGFAAALALQNRLVYEISGRSDGHMALLVCEHSPLITIGRQGSLAHVRWDSQQLTEQEVEVCWVGRGGGALIHGKGQLALYPIVPLNWYGLRVGDFLRRFQDSLLRALAELGVTCETFPDRFGLWGRSGQLVALGAAVKYDVSYHGAFVNVDIAPRWLRAVQADPEDPRPMGSLATERQRPVRMPAVREALFRHLGQAFACQRVHVFSGHPQLPARAAAPREANRRVG